MIKMNNITNYDILEYIKKKNMFVYDMFTSIEGYCGRIDGNHTHTQTIFTTGLVFSWGSRQPTTGNGYTRIGFIISDDNVICSYGDQRLFQCAFDEMKHYRINQVGQLILKRYGDSNG